MSVATIHSSHSLGVFRASAQTSASIGKAPAAQSGDLTREIDQLKEANLDYQILRKTFALDASSETSSVRRASDVTHNTRLAQTDAAGASATRSDGVLEARALRVRLELGEGVEQSFALEAGRSGRFSDIVASHRRSLELSMSVRMEAEVQVSDPLVLDLSGEGIATSGLDAGVRFDLDGDGTQEQVSFVSGGTWALALDRNGNGAIDDGRELFGDQHGAAHGFEELARFDDNQDGRINAQDEVFSRLRLVQLDAAGGQRQQSLEEAQVVAIDTGYQQTRKALNLYDRVAQSGGFERADGSRGEAADVLLAHRDLA